VTESRSRRQFSDLVAEAEIPLAQGALLIACEEYPALDVPAYVTRIETMASELRAGWPESATLEARLAALNDYLFGRLRFRGNDGDYFDPRNSFLNDVLDRRTGIPITLSTVYLEVGRRVGLNVEGVGLPGHFIVRVDDRLVDPYAGGTLLSHADCQRRLDRIYEGRKQLDASMLEPCPARAMLERMLRNLKAIYVKNGDALRALGVVELLLRLEPGSAGELRDRALLHAELGCYGFAARDLEELLLRVPAAPDAGSLPSRIADLRQRAARLN